MTEPPKTSWQQRYGTYFIGLAIGCFLAGLMFYSRRLAYAPPPAPVPGASTPASTPPSAAGVRPTLPSPAPAPDAPPSGEPPAVK